MLSSAFATIAALRGSPFALNVAGSLLARGALLAIGFVSTIVIARSLGPTGRGEYAVAVAIGATGVQLTNLGLHTSSSWAVAQRPALLGSLLANGVIGACLLGGLAALALGAVVIVDPSVAPFSTGLALLALASIPLGLIYLVEQNLLLGLQRVRAFNVLELLNRGGGVVALLVLTAAGGLTSFTALGTYVGAGALVAIAAFVALLRAARSAVRPRRDLLAEYGAYGLRAYVATLFTYLVLRVDLLIVEYLRGSADAGQYSIAVALAELAYVVPVVVANILFPRLTMIGERKEQVRLTTRTTTAIAVYGGAAAVLAVLLGEPATRLLYGTEYLPSVAALVWLLPGTALLSVNTILMHFYFAIGTPRVTIIAPALATGVNVVLNLLLVPTGGIVAASIAATVGYAIMLGITAVFFLRIRRETGRAA